LAASDTDCPAFCIQPPRPPRPVPGFIARLAVASWDSTGG
jgi:hypothetical protein